MPHAPVQRGSDGGVHGTQHQMARFRLTSRPSASARRTSGLTREYIRTHDELLNEMQMGIRGKFSDVHAAFRAFDTNADGLISL